MKARLMIVFLGGLWAAWQATPLAAQNLLVNPNFDTGLEGWTLGAIATWDGTADSDGEAGSGSVRANAPGDKGPFQTVVSQCVRVNQGTSYVFGGEIFVPGGQPDVGGGAITAMFYPNSNCTGTLPSSQPIAPLVTNLNGWTASSVVFTASGSSVLVSALVFLLGSQPFQANFDDLILEPAAGACVTSPTAICLNHWRFKVEATFNTSAGSDAASAHAVQLTAGSGYLWFFNAAVPEILVKVFNGCALGGHYWVFAGGLTNVNVVLTVTDTVTGAVKTYTNPLNTALTPIQDTSAFNCT